MPEYGDALVPSKNGEKRVFSREASKEKAPTKRSVFVGALDSTYALASALSRTCCNQSAPTALRAKGDSFLPTKVNTRSRPKRR